MTRVVVLGLGVKGPKRTRRNLILARAGGRCEGIPSRRGRCTAEAFEVVEPPWSERHVALCESCRRLLFGLTEDEEKERVKHVRQLDLFGGEDGSRG